eukprot:477661-Ditylum_brightwellii.AAC.1
MLNSSLKSGVEGFEFIEQESLSHYLGVEVVRSHDPKNKSSELRQPYLISKIVELVDFTPDVNVRDLDGQKRKQSWHYRGAVGMLSYHQGTSRPEIAM